MTDPQAESLRTVVVAGAANLAIATAKAVAGLVSGSAAMLSSYIVLAVAFAIESVSLSRALRQLRGAARRWNVPKLQYLWKTPDTALTAVTLEDSAALAGLLIAGLGLALTEVTGNPVWDGIGSIAIGLLLAAVAVALGRANVSLLILEWRRGGGWGSARCCRRRSAPSWSGSRRCAGWKPC